MSVVLGRRHRLLHVRSLLSRWYNREQEVHQVRSWSLRYPELLHQEGRPHGHRYGKKAGCKEYHTANQLQRRCRKKCCENIHDQFIGDKFFRKTMIELGEEIIFEMDRFASEDHRHIATQEEIDVYRGNWWIRSNVVNFDTMPTRHRVDFKKALLTLYRLEKAEDKAHHEIGRTVPPHGGNGFLVSSLLWDFTTKMDWTLISNGETCAISEPTVHLWHESQKEFGAQFIVIISVTANPVYRHRRGV